MSTVTLEDLKHFWMPSGVPCFLADREDICDVVENIGFQIYYLISNNKTETKTTHNSPTNNNNPYTTTYGYGSNNFNSASTSNTYSTFKIDRKPQLFKVVNNYVGRVVVVSNDEFPKEFIDIEEECTYTMPLIPLDIVNKLDEFFRLVYSQHGTESIVILTYDTTKEGPEGWGVLVPEQTNTAAHCKYDADSVAAIKPDNVIIVGSVHSHPQMSAYASGTDHQDQADFDGIHITYGWQNSVNNGATQYYAELQMSGKSYKLDIDDVFETVTLGKDPDPEVVEWSTKVKKAFPPYQGGQFKTTTQVSSRPTSITPQIGNRAGVYKDDLTRSMMLSGTNYHNAIKDLNLPSNSVIVPEIDLSLSGTGHCPICEYPLNIEIIRIGRCDVCDTPLADTEDHISTIIEKVELYFSDYRLPYTTPVYLFSQENGKPLVIKINDELMYYTGISQKNSHSEERLHMSKKDNDDSDYVYLPTETPEDLAWQDYDNGFNYEYMVCCGIKIAEADQDCYCPTKIYPTDLNEFDEVIKDNGEIYTPKASCHSCAHYYLPKCPIYREILTSYTRNKSSFDFTPYLNSITGCSNYVHFSQVNGYVSGKEEQYYGA